MHGEPMPVSWHEPAPPPTIQRVASAGTIHCPFLYCAWPGRRLCTTPAPPSTPPNGLLYSSAAVKTVCPPRVSTETSDMWGRGGRSTHVTRVLSLVSTETNAPPASSA